MQAAIVAVVVALTGCDTVFGVKGTVDGAPIDAPPAAGSCSAITMLSDTFDEDDLATQWGSSSATGGLAGRYSFADNTLQVSNVMPDGHVTIANPFYFDFRGQKFSFQLGDNGGITDGNQLVVSLDSTHAVTDSVTNTKRQRHLDIYRFGSRLQARAIGDGGSVAMIADLDYDPMAHAYMRIGLEDTQAVFETSANGSDWKKQGSTLYDGMDFVSVKFDLFRAALGGDVAISLADIMGGVPRAAACKANTIVDTFEGTARGEQWANTVESGNGGFFVQGGLLRGVTPDVTLAGAQASAILASALPYDLTDSDVLMDVVTPLAPEPEKSILFAVGEYGADVLEMQLSGGRLSIKVARTTPPTSATLYDQVYDPTTQHWWRIKNTPEGTTFDVSADGIGWTMLALNVAAKTPEVGLITIGISSTSKTPDQAQFDNVNAAPH